MASLAFQNGLTGIKYRLSNTAYHSKYSVEVLHDEPLSIGAECRIRWSRQEAQLPQRDRATRYASKFVLFHKMWELERFQTAKVTFKVIQGH